MCHNFTAYSRTLLPFKDKRPEKEETVHAVEVIKLIWLIVIRIIITKGYKE